MATYTGTDADETITPVLVSPTVARNPAGAVPGDAADTLYGGGGSDTLDGGGGNDTLDGGTGADDMGGGHGNDLYMADNVGDIAEESGSGVDTVRSSVSWTLSVNLENLTLTGTANLNGTGNGRGNVIYGNTGNNELWGLDGDDTLNGGGGQDTLNGGDGNDSLAQRGGAGSTLNGGAGDDTLRGGKGHDRLEGGTGNDIYILSDGGDAIIEELDGGIDTVMSSFTSGLQDNVENLTLTGVAAINGHGNTLANTIIGNANNNFLDGGIGADDMNGGAGDDTYNVDNVGDYAHEGATDGGVDTVRSWVTYELASNIENLVLVDGAGPINGTGNAGDNVITGNGAANILSGKGGNDTLRGAGGEDIFRFDTALVAGEVTTIVDFGHALGKIELARSVFTDAGPLGRLQSKAFYVGTAAHDSSDRVVYNAITGDLLYDPDGGRGQVGTVFAILTPGLALNSADFRVI